MQPGNQDGHLNKKSNGKQKDMDERLHFFK